MDHNLKTNVSPEQPERPNVETPRKPLVSHKQWWLFGVVIVLVISGAAVLITKKPVTPTETSESKQVSTVIGSIESYEDCSRAEGSTISNDQCVTSDGRVFFIDDAAIDQTEAALEQSRKAAESTEGNQSLRLCLVSCEHGYPDTLDTLPTGALTVDKKVILQTTGLNVPSCTLTVVFTPDKSSQSVTQQSMPAQTSQNLTFADGVSVLTAECPTNSGGKLTATRTVRVIDNLPEQCNGFIFSSPTQSTANTIDDLEQALAGTWTGCVETPWWTTYFVTITFNANGTYNASSAEELDGNVSTGGFYDYNIAGANSGKTYDITSYQNGAAQGFIDMVHPNGVLIQRGDLRNLILSDDRLTFDFYHLQKYGPVRFKLSKQ